MDVKGNQADYKHPSDMQKNGDCMLLRLDKYLCDMQIGTRSAVKDIIKKKRVTVNGSVVTKPETKVDTDKDSICVDNVLTNYSEYEYYMLNKPQGVVSATSDSNDKTVIDIIEDKKRKDLFPVGRLDKDTEGLLLITNDGELAHRLLSPKHHVDKTYFATVKGSILPEHIKSFEEGLKVDKEFTALPADLKVIKYNADNDTTDVKVTIQEGKFHQIKRMFEAIDSKVLYLKRLSMGRLMLDENLKIGEYRKLTKEELELLK